MRQGGTGGEGGGQDNDRSRASQEQRTGNRIGHHQRRDGGQPKGAGQFGGALEQGRGGHRGATAQEKAGAAQVPPGADRKRGQRPGTKSATANWRRWAGCERLERGERAGVGMEGRAAWRMRWARPARPQPRVKLPVMESRRARWTPELRLGRKAERPGREQRQINWGGAEKGGEEFHVGQAPEPGLGPGGKAMESAANGPNQEEGQTALPAGAPEGGQPGGGERVELQNPGGHGYSLGFSRSNSFTRARSSASSPALSLPS